MNNNQFSHDIFSEEREKTIKNVKRRYRLLKYSLLIWNLKRFICLLNLAARIEKNRKRRLSATYLDKIIFG